MTTKLVEGRGLRAGQSEAGLERGGAKEKTGCWAGPQQGAGLLLPRKLDEQRDCQAGQEIKQQEFVHLLSQASLPALRKEERVIKTSGPRHL